MTSQYGCSLYSDSELLLDFLRSRATSLDGLQVLNFDAKKVLAHPKVIQLDERATEGSPLISSTAYRLSIGHARSRLSNSHTDSMMTLGNLALTYIIHPIDAIGIFGFSPSLTCLYRDHTWSVSSSDSSVANLVSMLLFSSQASSQVSHNAMTF